MAESQGGASNADPKKKDPSLAEDFGKDFLSSWKSAKMGNDAPAPSNKKKSFNFDNDDFELGADFGKLSSFKMDMHDFDFSSPIKKTEKPKEKPCKEFVHGKQELKEDKFSFTFDFNGLDRFDLDSNLLMGEKISSKCTDANTPDYSNKNDKKEESRRNSVMSVDVSEDAEIKKLPTSECTSVSKSEDLIVSNILHGGGPSTSSYSGHDEVPSKAIQYITDKIDILDENKNDIHNSEGHKQHPSGIHFLKQHDDKVTQELPLQSVSDDSSAQEAPFQLQTTLASLNPEKANSAKELEDSMKPVHCSLSMNSSPIYSCNSRSWSGTSITELPNISGEYQNHQGNINEATGANEVLSESTEDRNDTEAASTTVLSQKVSRELKYLDEKLISGTKFLPSPLRGGSIVPKSMSVKDKANAAIQLKPLSKLTDNVSQQASALTTKILYPVDCGKIKPIKMHPANVNRQTKQNDVLKAEKLKVGISKSYDKGLTKSVLVNTGSQKNKIIDTPRQPQQNDGLKEQKQVGILKSYDQGLIGSSSVTTGCERIDDVDTSRLQLHSSKLPGKSPSSIIAKGIISNPVSGSEFMKSSKKFSIERQDLSQEDDKICDISSLKISGTTKLNINTPNSTMPKEEKSARVSGRNLEFQNTASSVCRSNSTEKYSLSSPSLKRKTLEESKADPEASNPFKRVMETATERSKPPKVSPKDDWKVVAEVENLKTTSGSPEIGSIADFEVPILVENDGNVEKAEVCSKELGNICNMLKKKHEEAKELLVRATVTNNELLMLNHPVFAEKICALQKFAISLQSKQF